MRVWYRLNPDHSVEPCSAAEFEDNIHERQVACTEISDTLYVSTVFLSLDHGYSDSEPPVLFETMIFRNDGGEECGEQCWRYHTWDEAVEGHQKVCANLVSGLSREELEAAKTLIEPLLKDK